MKDETEQERRSRRDGEYARIQAGIWQLHQAPRALEKEGEAMDERMLSILRAVAYERTANDDADTSCVFCLSSPKKIGEQDYEMPDRVRHEPTCATVEARSLMREQGTPLRIYTIDYEYLTSWHEMVHETKCVTAYDEREVWLWWNVASAHQKDIQHVQVTMVCEL